MLADAQNKRAIAVDGDDIGVAARRAVFAHQAAVEDSFRDRLEIQLLRQAVAAKPAGFNHFKTCFTFAAISSRTSASGLTCAA